MAARQGYEVEPDSATWREIEQWIEERLRIRRSALESTGLPIDETENARGAIEELNELRGLARPQVIAVPDAEGQF